MKKLFLSLAFIPALYSAAPASSNTSSQQNDKMYVTLSCLLKPSDDQSDHWGLFWSLRRRAPEGGFGSKHLGNIDVNIDHCTSSKAFTKIQEAQTVAEAHTAIDEYHKAQSEHAHSQKITALAYFSHHFPNLQGLAINQKYITQKPGKKAALVAENKLVITPNDTAISEK